MSDSLAQPRKKNTTYSGATHTYIYFYRFLLPQGYLIQGSRQKSGEVAAVCQVSRGGAGWIVLGWLWVFTFHRLVTQNPFLGSQRSLSIPGKALDTDPMGCGIPGEWAGFSGAWAWWIFLRYKGIGRQNRSSSWTQILQPHSSSCTCKIDTTFPHCADTHFSFPLQCSCNGRWTLSVGVSLPLALSEACY